MIPSFQVAREHVLPLFNDVFSAMSVAITDVDQVCSKIFFRSLKHVFCNYSQKLAASPSFLLAPAPRLLRTWALGTSAFLNKNHNGHSIP